MSTNTKTFTVTDARYLGSKIAADLRQLQIFYGQPTDAKIEKYIDEFVQLLKDGYLESVDYGFQKNGIWVVALSYEVSQFNNIDNSPGRVPVGVDISGASWYSYLRKSLKFYFLPSEEQTRIENSLPIDRGSGPDPQNSSSFTYDKSYGSGDVELKRKTYK